MKLFKNAALCICFLLITSMLCALGGDENSTYLCICSGKANTYKADGTGKKLVKSEHHKASRYIKKGDSFKRKPAPLLYHDDDTMEALADKINVSVDWGEEKSY